MSNRLVSKHWRKKVVTTVRLSKTTDARVYTLRGHGCGMVYRFPLPFSYDPKRPCQRRFLRSGDVKCKFTEISGIDGVLQGEGLV